MIHRTARRGAVALVVTAVVATLGHVRVATSAPDRAGPLSTPTTTAAPHLVGGVYTAPDGSFSAPFAAVPTIVVDGPSTSIIAGSDGDSTTILVTPPGAFETDPSATPGELAAALLNASGTDVELLANTATTLGRYPAAYFIGRLELRDGAGDAVVYGVVVTRPTDVVVTFATDLGGDDGDAAREFVESFTLHLGPAPSRCSKRPATGSSARAMSTPIRIRVSIVLVPRATASTASAIRTATTIEAYERGSSRHRTAGWATSDGSTSSGDGSVIGPIFAAPARPPGDPRRRDRVSVPSSRWPTPAARHRRRRHAPSRCRRDGARSSPGSRR